MEILKSLDLWVFYLFNRLPHPEAVKPWLVGFHELLDRVDIGYYFLGFVFVLGIVFRKKELWIGTIALLGAFFCTNLVNQILKALFARPRPGVSLKDIYYVGSLTKFSFPSQVAMNASLLATFIFRTWHHVGAKFLAIALMIFTGFFRIYMGVHYPSDIAGGWVIGFAIGLIIFWMYSLTRHLLNRKAA